MSIAIEPGIGMRRLGRAASLGVLAQLLTLAAGLWATPRLVHGLTDAAYGVLAIVVSFSAYFAYLELGIGGAYIRALSISLAQKEGERSQLLTDTAQFVYLSVAAVGCLLMLALGMPYLSHVVTDASLLAEARLALIAVALTFSGTMALSAPRAVVIATQRTDLYMTVGLVLQPLIPLAQVAIVMRGGHLTAVLVVQSIGTLLIDLVLYRYAKKLQPALRYFPRMHRAIWLELRDFSQKKFVSQLAQQAQWTGDRLLVGATISSTAVALYAVPASIAQRLRMLTGAVLSPAFPAFAEAFSHGGGGALQLAVRQFGRRVGLLLAFAIAGGLTLAYPFLLAWMGIRFAENGTIILQTQLIATGLLVVSGLFGLALEAAGHAASAMQAALIGLVVSIGVSLLLVSRFGGTGVSYGFLTGAFAQCAWSTWQLRAFAGLSRALLFDCLGKPALLCVAAYTATRLMPASKVLLGSIMEASAGAIAGFALGLVTGLIYADDLPHFVARRLTRQPKDA